MPHRRRARHDEQHRGGLALDERAHPTDGVRTLSTSHALEPALGLDAADDVGCAASFADLQRPFRRFEHLGREHSGRSAFGLQLGPFANLLVRFAATGAIAVLVAVVGGITLLQPGIRRAENADARADADVIAEGVVEPLLRAHTMTPTMQGALSEQLEKSAVNDEVTAVRVLDESGTVVAATPNAATPARLRLDREERAVLATGRPIIRYGRGDSSRVLARPVDAGVYEVVLRVRGRDDRPYLVETVALHNHDVHGIGVRRILVPTAAAIGLLWLVQLPAAYVMTRSLEDNRRERETLLLDSINAASEERRRIARTVHDGALQDLGRLTRSLSGSGSPLASDAERIAVELRTGLGEVLRSDPMPMLCPHDLQSIATQFGGPDVVVTVNCPPTAGLASDARIALGDLLREAVRNAAKHGRASTIAVAVSVGPSEVMASVTDDGQGFDTVRLHAGATPDRGLSGFQLHREAVVRLGGHVHVVSAPGRGSRMTVRMPRQQGARR
jgi:two-component system, NarL family, sensor kinase